jgi:hypothetical protein
MSHSLGEGYRLQVSGFSKTKCLMPDAFTHLGFTLSANRSSA